MVARVLVFVLVLCVFCIVVESSHCPLQTGRVRCLKRCPTERLQPGKTCTKGRVCCLRKHLKVVQNTSSNGEQNDRPRSTSTEKTDIELQRITTTKPLKPSKAKYNKTDISLILQITKRPTNPGRQFENNKKPFKHQNKKNEQAGKDNFIKPGISKNSTYIHTQPARFETEKSKKWHEAKKRLKTTKLPKVVNINQNGFNRSHVTGEQQVETGHTDSQSGIMSAKAWNALLNYIYSYIAGKGNRTRGMVSEKSYDCGDAEDRLVCRRSCPERRRDPERSCPFNRICCRGKPSSVYSPLRQVPFYTGNKDNPSSEGQVYSYLINRYNGSDPISVVNIDESNDIQRVTYRPNVHVSNNSEDNNVIPEESIRKSVRNCRRYQELTVDYLHAMPLLPEFLPFTLPMDNCLPRFIPLIVGGRNATKGEFPHMAAVGYHRNDFIEYLCGGTLISEKFVLTAAHCAQTKWGSPATVMLGSILLYADDGIEIGVRRTIPHPDYKPPSYYHDIALIELKKDATFSQFVRPACLALPATEAQESGSVAIATGWGKTGFARPSSMHLMKVPLKVLQNKECEEYYASDVGQPALLEGINDKLICATGHESEYHDTCQGDSGGPLQAFLPGHNCMLEIVAVTSFGKTCGTAIPGVYTKIEPYISWIEDVVWP